MIQKQKEFKVEEHLPWENNPKIKNVIVNVIGIIYICAGILILGCAVAFYFFLPKDALVISIIFGSFGIVFTAIGIISLCFKKFLFKLTPTQIKIVNHFVNKYKNKEENKTTK